MPSLLLSIRFLDGRYHGVPDWPPSPARVFQALVAAAARGTALPDEAKVALEWLENLNAPVIAAPKARSAKGFDNFVPNNDLDAVGGDLKRIGEIRAAKRIHPWLFDSETPLLYVWAFEESEEAKTHAEKICDVAFGLYQLGRGVDMAWGWGEIVPDESRADRLADYPGAVHRPSVQGVKGGETLACPQRGSLASLILRHQKSAERFETLFKAEPTEKKPDQRKASGRLFTQPPKPRFRQAAYDCPPTYLLFDLRGPDSPWPQAKIAELTERLRDCAAQRLTDALPDKKGCIEKVFVGRSSTEADKAARIRIIPLPSIGHSHADHAIRRVLIEIPPDCPLPIGDIDWAFSGLPIIDAETGEVRLELATADTRTMLKRYGVEADKLFRLWRTVTAIATPTARRRIDPMRMREDAKGGKERADEEARAAGAILQALRHSGVAAPVLSIRAQREPFEAKGARAETFSPGTRFAKERLWHAEIAFAEAVSGPLVIGDGRYLGLGLLRPAAKEAIEKAFVFDVASDKLIPAERRADFLRAVRRTLMALDRDHGGRGGVSRLFSGHETDGAPARSGTHEHVFLAATAENGEVSKLYVLSPALADRRTKLHRDDHVRFSEIVRKLELVRAGELGVIKLTSSRAGGDQRFFLGASREWTSETAYIPTRHLKPKDDPHAWMKDDVLRECDRRGIPRPDIEVLSIEGEAKSKPRAYLRLVFQSSVKGPILIGQGAHFGAGLFRAEIA